MNHTAPPPYNDLPSYDDSVEKMKQKQTEIESLLQNLLTTKNATLSKTTQDIIRNIMFIFENRFDSLEKELITKIRETAAWLESIPVVEKEHTKMKGQVEQLLAHTESLDARIKKLGQSIKHKLRPIDRWTDPKNAMCRVNMVDIGSFSFSQRYQSEVLVTDYLLKPLPHYVNENSGNLGRFLARHRTEYICSCYNCILFQVYGLKASMATHRRPRDGEKTVPMCPLDSDCTCMTMVHRSSFLHSIEGGYIKGRDKELSPIQLYFATHLYHGTDNNLVCIPNLDGLSVSPDGIVNVKDLQNIKFFIIVNCTKRDGVDVYQYQTWIGHPQKYQLHETTEDKLYVRTNRYEYPPRDPATFISSDYHLLSPQEICVPIEQYMADTMFSDNFIMDEPEYVQPGGSLYDNKGKLLYRGQMKNGVPHGYGTGYYANGKVGHTGMFKGGKIVQ